MNLHLSSQDGRLIRLLGRSSFLFSPMFDLNYMENDCPLRVKPLDNNLTDIAPTGKLRIAEEQQTKVLQINYRRINLDQKGTKCLR